MFNRVPSMGVPWSAGAVVDVTLPRQILDRSTTGCQSPVLGPVSYWLGWRRKGAVGGLTAIVPRLLSVCPNSSYRAKLLSVLYLSTCLHETEKNDVLK